MAKNKQVGLVASVAAATPAVTIIHVPAGGSLTVEVDVTNPSADYTVTFGNMTLMFSRVDRRETVPNLGAGRYVLGWHFAHFAKKWAHKISAKPSSGGAVVLESRSEAKKDAPRSVGLALVVVS